jgi:hypothetical protein
MLTKHHWTSHKILILGACLFLPSLAHARSITPEGFAVLLLGVDVVVLTFAIVNVLVSNGLGIRLLTLYSGINIAVLIVGILTKVFIYFGTTTLSANDLLGLSSLIAAYSTGYLVIAVPIHFVVLMLLAVVKVFRK